MDEDGVNFKVGQTWTKCFDCGKENEPCECTNIGTVTITNVDRDTGIITFVESCIKRPSVCIDCKKEKHVYHAYFFRGRCKQCIDAWIEKECPGLKYEKNPLLALIDNPTPSSNPPGETL